MDILLLHNYYLHRGGEEQVFEAERRLLEEHGHRVSVYTLNNTALKELGSVRQAAFSLWNPAAYRAVRALAPAGGVVHVHNPFPLLSPAVYYAARHAGAAVVQTLHNYRLLCPNALFTRGGRVCTDCLGRAVAWPGMVHGCYRGSRAASAVVVLMLALHRALGTYRRQVNRYIVLTPFARSLFVRGGLPREKITVKPNFVAGEPQPGNGEGGYMLFVGRLSPEKGIGLLLEAWKKVKGGRLVIAGDGPEAPRVEAAARADGRITWVGRLAPAGVAEQMREALCLVLPSTCFENLPITLMEAFSAGTPVLAPRLGTLEALVEAGRTGLAFAPHSPEALAEAMEYALSHPQEMRQMRRAARAEYLARYTPEVSYPLLMQIYREALADAGEDSHARG
ncbi:MAG TPA: glycosyl transferase family 1 [Anaerolinea thermolimosa]|uniref:Glycosyl transferase family 1 n=1 Tax=Anaerolinea thermolimosa TaxID=229919 RepID=A0A3D1JDZ8_9CHLR|nr:glycosyl transferase family 1 [Anaerolinea thermolimosa]